MRTLVQLKLTAGQSGWIETTLQEVVTGKLYVILLSLRSAQNQLELSVRLFLVNLIKAQVKSIREKKTNIA